MEKRESSTKNSLQTYPNALLDDLLTIRDILGTHENAIEFVRNKTKRAFSLLEGSSDSTYLILHNAAENVVLEALRIFDEAGLEEN